MLAARGMHHVSRCLKGIIMDNNNDKLDLDSVEHHLTNDVSAEDEAVDASRRHFAKSGLIVSGVLLTLASRPSLGGGTGGGFICKTASGFTSANLSNHGRTVSCSGRTPGYWANHYDWPSPFKTGTCTNTKLKQSYTSWSNTGTTSGTKYHDLSVGFYGTKYKTYSMMQVTLLGGTGDPYQLGAHCVAAILNARKGWTPVLTEAQVRNMYKEYITKGYFSPTAGVKWYAADIVKYLKTTMPL